MMKPVFRLCTLSDIPAANIPFVKAYNFAENQEEMLAFFWSLQPDGWWIGFKDTFPCAFGGAVDYGEFSSIGMIAVDPTFQNQGIGTALMRHIVHWCEQRSCPTMVLEANLKAVSLYKRLGFIEEEPTSKFKRTPDTNILELPSGIELLKETDIPDVTRFDAYYFGARREKILTAYLASNPEKAFISREQSGKITGYIFANTRFLGPWIAETPADAEKLLQSALTLSFIDGPNNTLSSSNQRGIELLKRYGFSESTPSVHMRLGPPIHSMQRPLIFGQASMALG